MLAFHLASFWPSDLRERVDQRLGDLATDVALEMEDDAAFATDHVRLTNYGERRTAVPQRQRRQRRRAGPRRTRRRLRDSRTGRAAAVGRFAGSVALGFIVVAGLLGAAVVGFFLVTGDWPDAEWPEQLPRP